MLQGYYKGKATTSFAMSLAFNAGYGYDIGKSPTL